MKHRAIVVFAAGALGAACLFPQLDNLSAKDAASNDVSDSAIANDVEASARCAEPVTAQLIAHWPMDEGSGTTLSDCGNQFAGVITGDVTWITNESGLDFGGNGQVAITSSSAFHVGDFTATADIRPTTPDIPSYLGQIVGSNDSWGMYLVQGLGFAMTIYDSSGTDEGWLPPKQNVPFVDAGVGPWTSVATVLRNGTQREEWIAGVLVNQDVVEAGAFTSPASSSVCFGAYEDGFTRRLIGQVRNVRIFSRALTQAEIQTL